MSQREMHGSSLFLGVRTGHKTPIRLCYGTKVKKNFDAYRGKLTPAQAAAGMNAAAKNARRLAKDAATLLGAGSFPTTASMAILSIEEAGKISILRTFPFQRQMPILRKPGKTIGRTHAKMSLGFSRNSQPPVLASSMIFSRCSMKRPTIRSCLDQLKQVGFYTDCLGKAQRASPVDVIDERLARMLVEIAQLFARDREYTEQEIHLWVQHVGPVWKTNPAWMKQALVNWYAAIQKAGLVPEGNNDMEQFIRPGYRDTDRERN